MQKAFTFKSLWSSSGVLRGYPSTATLTAEKDQAPKRRSPVKGHVTFKLTACTAVLSGRPHSGMRPSCARCHSNAVFVTTENGRLWVGQELKPGETRKRNTSFSWEQPESSSHGQLFFTVCSYPGLCLLVCLKKNHQQNKHTRKHISTFVTPESTYTKERFFSDRSVISTCHKWFWLTWSWLGAAGWHSWPLEVSFSRIISGFVPFKSYQYICHIKGRHLF